MKSFKEYISEDIELTSVMNKPGAKKRPYIGMSEDQWREHAATQKRKIEPIGTMGKDYTVYSSINRYGDNNDYEGADSSNPQRRVAHYTHHFLTVHNKTKTVVASAVGMGERGSWSSKATFVDPKHTSKKVGFSIPAEMYKHISKTYEIWADKEQTPGAAKMWKTIIQDPKNKVEFVPAYGRWGKPEPARGISDDRIWATHKQDKETNAAAKKVGLTPNQATTDEWGRVESEESEKAVNAGLRLLRKKP